MEEDTSIANKELPVFTLLGARLHALRHDDLCCLIEHTVACGEKLVIGHHNLHSLYLYHQDAKMQEFYMKAHYVYVDGMSFVLLGRLLGLPLRRHHRMTLLDWVGPLMNESVKQGWRVFFLGARPSVAARAADIFRAKFPGLLFETAHGYFDMTSSEENEAVLAKVQRYQPHILIVGMGMPRQEHWILDHCEGLGASVILAAGGIMDYIAGAVPTPPRWMGRLGLEWLFRLFSEPRRLWKRYLLEPWFILVLLLRALTKGPSACTHEQSDL